MEIKLSRLPTLVESLKDVMDLSLPVKTAYWFARTADEVESEYRKYEKTRMSLLKKHSEIDEDGEIKRDGNEAVLKDREAFNKDFEELLHETATIKMDPLSIDKLGNDTVSVSTLKGLLPLLGNEGEDDAKEETDKDS